MYFDFSRSHRSDLPAFLEHPFYHFAAWKRPGNDHGGLLGVLLCRRTRVQRLMSSGYEITPLHEVAIPSIVMRPYLTVL